MVRLGRRVGVALRHARLEGCSQHKTWWNVWKAVTNEKIKARTKEVAWFSEPEWTAWCWPNCRSQPLVVPQLPWDPPPVFERYLGSCASWWTRFWETPVNGCTLIVLPLLMFPVSCSELLYLLLLIVGEIINIEIILVSQEWDPRA